MKKMIVPIAIGLVVGLGGSVAARMMLGKEPASLEASLEEAMGGEAADSSGAHATENDSTVVAHADSVAGPIADSLGLRVAVAETTHVTGHPAAAAFGANALVPGSDLQDAAAPATAGGAALPEGALTSAELAKLFASMQARDAAKVLEQMDDFEVQVILGALGNREAAAILANLSPERAAVISRAVIRGERSAR